MKKVRILDFWYGFKNDIPIGIKQIKTKKEYKKNFILKPVNQITASPPNKINNAVPKSGCNVTNKIGTNIAKIGTKIYLMSVTFSAGIL